FLAGAAGWNLPTNNRQMANIPGPTVTLQGKGQVGAEPPALRMKVGVGADVCHSFRSISPSLLGAKNYGEKKSSQLSFLPWSAVRSEGTHGICLSYLESRAPVAMHTWEREHTLVHLTGPSSRLERTLRAIRDPVCWPHRYPPKKLTEMDRKHKDMVIALKLSHRPPGMPQYKDVGNVRLVSKAKCTVVGGTQRRNLLAVVMLKLSYWGLEKEALIATCSREGGAQYPVDWYYSETNRSVTVQKTNRVFAAGKHLKFLPSEVNDTGTYTCIVRRPNANKTGYVNITIYKKPPDCNIPDDLLYSTVIGSKKNSRISCPTISNFNWTGPVEWFKNCKALRGPRYHAYKTHLVIDNVTSKDAGDYTCKFIHNENGASYSVTASRSFVFTEAESSSRFPVIIAPPKNETQEVEIGRTVNITCFACFGNGVQHVMTVTWQINARNVGYSEARIQQKQEQNQSNTPTCISTVLRITEVKEEDLSLKYDCVAQNLHGVRRHSIRLRRKNPIGHQNIYMLTGFSMLLMLINILVVLLKLFWIDVILFWRDIISPYKTRNDGKIYDAYVIYPREENSCPKGTSSVEYFVHQILPDVLENKYGYNLCIYGRDLLPGEDIATAVESNIRKSRRHIFILTTRIKHSQEFAYEQEIALHSALIKNDSKVILIEMEDLSGLQLEELQESLKHLLQVQGTIKWKEEYITNRSSLNSKFWKQVRYHMPMPNKLSLKTPNLIPLKTCIKRKNVTAVEGEPFYLKYCPFNQTNETTTIKWYKRDFHGSIELNSSSSPRIVPRGYILEFWPVELGDSGSYTLQGSSVTHSWNLKVIRRSEESCFTQKLVTSIIPVEVDKLLEVKCEHDYYKNVTKQTVVYKNCKKIEDNEGPHIKKNAAFEDQGYYTCIHFVDHNGKLFNVTKTFNVTIVGGHSVISPALHGPNPDYVKVELGEQVRLNCSASLNKQDRIYWLFENKNAHEENASVIQYVYVVISSCYVKKDKEGKWQASTILVIENINEKNLNASYNCCISSKVRPATKVFILLKKDAVDIPRHVFTGGMITAVLASVAVVCLLIVGVIYRVDVALFYRHFMRRDETLTDGKTYDAFVSYLKECQPENGEAHTFAVEILPRVLENHFGYKLCIFERDVMPGRAIVDEVHSLIEKSRRLIIVLSRSYMSNEVRYELESGLHEALVERKIKIILIKCTSFSDVTFLPQSLELLKSHRVLKWKADQSLSYNSRFWKDLLYLMPAKVVKPCRDESEFLPVLSQS
ncbi:Interleukin-1 receptor-like 1, partial [Galemys pyrenaicus]